MRSINKNFIGIYILVALVLLAVGELGFGLSAQLSEALGRTSNLSGRTELWKGILQIHTNPIVGTGFESFWLGERLQRLGEMFRWHPNEAHNGYLEIYLTLGVIGLSILAGVLIRTFWKIRFELFRNFQWGRFRLGFLMALVVYNWTEAAFKAFHPVWWVFCIIALDYPRRTYRTAGQPPVGVGRSEGSSEFAYAEAEF
jgi:O-antigen ligase